LSHGGRRNQVRQGGVEPPLVAYRATVLPLNYRRVGPTLWNRTRSSGSSDRRADHLRKSGGMGCREHPTSSSLFGCQRSRIHRRRRSPWPFKARMSRTPQFQKVGRSSPVVGAEGLEPSCKRFTAAASIPWSAPEKEKAARGCPGAALARSIYERSHSRPTLWIPGKALIAGEITDGNGRPGRKAHARIRARVLASRRFARRGSCRGHVQCASHRSSVELDDHSKGSFWSTKLFFPSWQILDPTARHHRARGGTDDDDRGGRCAIP
jgi:hypothetical protein